MTPDEKARKTEARNLIKKDPRNKRVHYAPGNTLSYARYMVEIPGSTDGVFFQDDGKRLWYLGEYPQENFEHNSRVNK